VKATSGSLYGAWSGQNWTFNGIATYGGLTTDMTRVVKYNLLATTGHAATAVDSTLNGSPDGRSFAIGATGGYQVQAASWDLVPSLSVNYRRVTIDSFTESDPTNPKDGLPLSFGDQTVESVRSVLGVDLSRPVSVSFGVVTPIFRVEWDHEFENGVRTIDAHYRFDPMIGGRCFSCFALPTDAPVADYGIAAVGVSVTLARRLQAFVYDEALFGYSDYHSNAVTIGVRGQF